MLSKVCYTAKKKKRERKFIGMGYSTMLVIIQLPSLLLDLKYFYVTDTYLGISNIGKDIWKSLLYVTLNSISYKLRNVLYFIKKFSKRQKNYIDFSFMFFSLIYIEKLLAWVKLKNKTKKTSLH